MRISEQRYTADRRALDVATRLLAAEARTGTIRQYTGLTPDRIRALSREYSRAGLGMPARRRGAAPHTLRCLLGRPQLRIEADGLLGLCLLMGVQPRRDDAASFRGNGGLSRAEQLCDAFWTFRYLFPGTSIGFEHMLLLLAESAGGGEAALIPCRRCKALTVIDRCEIYSYACLRCTSAAPNETGLRSGRRSRPGVGERQASGGEASMEPLMSTLPNPVQSRMEPATT